VLFLEHFYGHIAHLPGVEFLVYHTHKIIAKFPIESVLSIDQRIYWDVCVVDYALPLLVDPEEFRFSG